MTKEQFLETAGRHYDSIKSLESVDNFYDYEKQFVAIQHQLWQQVMEQSLGTIMIDNKHQFSKKPVRVYGNVFKSAIKGGVIAKTAAIGDFRY